VSLPAFWADGGVFGGGTSAPTGRMIVEVNVRVAVGVLRDSWRSTMVLERMADMLVTAGVGWCFDSRAVKVDIVLEFLSNLDNLDDRIERILQP